MNIPDKVKVGGITYDVVFLNHPSEENWNVDGAHAAFKQEIRIKEGMGADYSEVTFLHELLHAIFDHCGLDRDESVIERLAHCLYQVLKDNKLKF